MAVRKTGNANVWTAVQMAVMIWGIANALMNVKIIAMPMVRVK